MVDPKVVCSILAASASIDALSFISLSRLLVGGVGLCRASSSSVRSLILFSGRLLSSSWGSSQLSTSIWSTAVDTPVGLLGSSSRDVFFCAA